jgi:hypothetical protein
VTAITAAASRLLADDARALLTRLERVKPFVLHEPMVLAAAADPAAQLAIERYLALGRDGLRRRVHDYLRWLRSPAGRAASPEDANRRFTMLRLRFNLILGQFDIFADVLTQRSEHQTGVWLSGLDVAAADALALRARYYDPPPVLCYLDRGHGAAIRRARTRLPGGGENPVAIIRVPRERMVGSGIASSLVHEVGHQAAALLDLIVSLRPTVRGMQAGTPEDRIAWRFWERWLSEILADFWSVARVGVASTLGLMAVVGLPRAFVFRVNADDPHPIPWIRVKLSCAMGRALFPHPQWDALAAIWEAYYPLGDLDAPRRDLLARLQASMPGLVALLVNHRPRPLRGDTLREALAVTERQPARLTAHFRAWHAAPAAMRAAPPTLAFAVLGQARADLLITPEEESRAVSDLLTHWAVRSTLGAFAGRAARAALPRITAPRLALAGR